jgi:hypothetical protein
MQYARTICSRGASAALSQRCASLSSTQEGADHAARLRQNLDDTRNTLDALGRDYKVANDTYSYFVEMRTYVSALIDCLDEKVGVACGCV